MSLSLTDKCNFYVNTLRILVCIQLDIAQMHFISDTNGTKISLKTLQFLFNFMPISSGSFKRYLKTKNLQNKDRKQRT